LFHSGDHKTYTSPHP